jgi:hypothetical protein
MKKSEVFFITLCGFLSGVIIGFLMSPIKKGVKMGNNCGNTTNHYHYYNELSSEE